MCSIRTDHAISGHIKCLFCSGRTVTFILEYFVCRNERDICDSIIMIYDNMENQENNNGQLQIELKEEVAEGTPILPLSLIPVRSLSWILFGQCRECPKPGFNRVLISAPNTPSVCCVRLKKMLVNMNVLSALSACRMSNLFRHCLTLRVKHKIKKKLVVH